MQFRDMVSSGTGAYLRASTQPNNCIGFYFNMVPQTSTSKNFRSTHTHTQIHVYFINY